MKLLFLGSIYPKDREEEIYKISRFIDLPGNTLQQALINGFDQLLEVTIVTTPNIKTKQLRFQESDFEHISGSNDHCMGFCTSIISKSFVTGRSIARYVIKKEINPDIIFLYSIRIENLQAAAYLKKRYPHSQVVMMVTDLMDYMRTTKNVVYSILKKVETLACNFYTKSCVDSFVLLSAGMSEKLPIGNKPYVVVEGIYNSNDDVGHVEKDPHKVILYTGNIAARYGIKDLLDAFIYISDDNFRLWIRGNGECKKMILDYSQKDNRIVWFDRMSRSDLVTLEKKATILINPVHSTEGFTKYFFPSKTMEYLASGTPTLMCNLPCLPEEYKQHLYLFDDESISGMSKTMQEICNKSSEELKRFGQTASDFILNQKNEKVQTLKILNFLQKSMEVGR